MASAAHGSGPVDPPADDEFMDDVEGPGAQRQRTQSPSASVHDVPGVSTSIYDQIDVGADFLVPIKQRLKTNVDAAVSMVKESLQRVQKAQQKQQHMLQKQGCPSSLAVKSATFRFEQEILGQHSDAAIRLQQLEKNLQEERVNLMLACQATAVREAEDALAAAKTAAAAELESALTVSVPAAILQYRAVQVLFQEMRAALLTSLHQLEQQYAAQQAGEQQRQERRAANAEARAAQQGAPNLDEQVRQVAENATRDLRRQVTGLQQQVNQLRAAAEGRPAPRQQQQQGRGRAQQARQQQQQRAAAGGQQRPPPRAGSPRPAPRQQAQQRPAAPGNRAGDGDGAWQVPGHVQRRHQQQARQQARQQPQQQQQQRRRPREGAPFGRGRQ